jgi:hypothetical protein
VCRRGSPQAGRRCRNQIQRTTGGETVGRVMSPQASASSQKASLFQAQVQPCPSPRTRRVSPTISR